MSNIKQKNHLGTVKPIVTKYLLINNKYLVTIGFPVPKGKPHFLMTK